MAKLKFFLSTTFILLAAVGTSLNLNAQTIDIEAFSQFSPAVIRQTFEVCKLVKLSSEQQVSLAKSIEKENEKFIQDVKHNEGVLSVKGGNQLAKLRENTLTSLLDKEQIAQYYRGIYDAEADAVGNNVANTLQKKYNLTDQNWKFIRVAVYKYELDSRVIKKLYADQPKKAAKMIADLKAEQLKTIEEKGDIRVNPDKMTVEFLKEFNPDTLHK